MIDSEPLNDENRGLKINKCPKRLILNILGTFF